ncbi:cystatin-like fold lipoprotein [Rossellomorea yichunensis]|uniref:cystatin-like fold lipoprotein n=1 Tax=Rossellomorea yichunensis TaxID=3077331 RepID=UPI0028DF9B72|nr:cystatin-like fold lipoprotein [Rossellomorea sp. YC4-1]MDT9027507.1 cystatin-like fold lipoprotein [Rossellomorea sp. YC4-1]
MMKRAGIVVTAAMLLVACGNSYDKAIDEVIKLENVSLKEPGLPENINELKRDKACTKVFDEGKVITITYEIRENDFVTEGFVKKNGDYKAGATEKDMKSAEPIYVENEDLCQN